MENFTEQEITESLPHLKEAFLNLFAMWDALTKIELICGRDIDSSSLSESCIASLTENELTDEVLTEFFKEL